MTTRNRVIGLILAMLVLAGAWAGCGGAESRTAGWLRPLADLMVAVPAVYALVLLVEASWRKAGAGRGDTPVARVRRGFADALVEMAGRLPVIALGCLAVGLAVQIVLTAAAFGCAILKP